MFYPLVCSEWGEWSVCSATCNGMQTRVHHCKNATHESDELQARPCNTNPCPPKTPPTTTPSTTSTTPTTPTTTPTTTQNCTDWSQWSECTRSCGGGYQERFRTCPDLEQQIDSRMCNTQPCPTPIPTTPKPPIIPGELMRITLIYVLRFSSLI